MRLQQFIVSIALVLGLLAQQQWGYAAAVPPVAQCQQGSPSDEEDQTSLHATADHWATPTGLRMLPVGLLPHFPIAPMVLPAAAQMGRPLPLAPVAARLAWYQVLFRTVIQAQAP